MIEQLKEIARLVSEVGPKLEQAQKYDGDAVMIETNPLMWADGGFRARVWGPFENESTAHNFVHVKKDRHLLANAHFHGEKGSPCENDKHVYGHPGLQYRVVSAAGYFSKYLAQIQMACTSAFVGEICYGENDIPFEPPGDSYGVTDDDLEEDDDE
jgi:hypothetical protein